MLIGICQLDGIDEDRIAKPHRPLPSGRITPGQATLLYYVLFLLMWIAAIHTNTITCTVVYSVAIVIYNEGGLAGIPVVKNFIGAIGIGCYCWGTTIILGISFRKTLICYDMLTGFTIKTLAENCMD